jgi:hypothetical protein
MGPRTAYSISRISWFIAIEDTKEFFIPTPFTNFRIKDKEKPIKEYYKKIVEPRKDRHSSLFVVIPGLVRHVAT